MRPIADKNGSVQTPLDEILGFQGNIRLLRCFCERINSPNNDEISSHTASLSHSEVAERTGLTIPGVHKVVSRLINTGLLEYSGSGKRQLITLRSEHPLYTPLVELFKAEKKRFETLKKSIIEILGKNKHKPKSAWIFGKVVNGNDKYGDPLNIAVIGDFKEINNITVELKASLRKSRLEQDFDVTITIQGLSPGDDELITPKLQDGYIHLYGMDPIFLTNHLPGNELISVSESFSHYMHDKKSLENGYAWAQLLRMYPEIIPRTVRYLAKRIENSDSGIRNELKQWKDLLESMSVQRLIKFITSDTEEATRLRQSNPFLYTITDEEKIKLDEFLKSGNQK